MTDLFDVLSDSTRRDIISLLRSADGTHRERSVGELVDALGITQPTVSKHLKVLRESGLVLVREEGQHRYYRLDATALRDVATWLHEVTGGATGHTSQPYIDLDILGRATGGLAKDAVKFIEDTLGKILR